MDKENADTYYSVGYSFLEQSRLLEAINAFAKAIRFNPELLDVYFLRGMAKGNSGSYDKAIEDFEI
jgi:tetratricopeptide (TPR) repeat protein